METHTDIGYNRVGGGPSYSMSRWPAYVHASMPACRPYRAYKKRLSNETVSFLHEFISEGLSSPSQDQKDQTGK